jgi:hypothetical protein
MHQDKCVNKHWWILKMDYKRQTAALSVMFVLVGMMFIVPAITEKAMAQLVARADGKCGTGPCTLILRNAFLVEGRWVPNHTPTHAGQVVTWAAHRVPTLLPPYASGIAGQAIYQVYPDGHRAAVFSFDSPFILPNTCKIQIIPPVSGSHLACDKGSGISPEMFYYFVLPSPASGSGSNNSGSDSGDDNGDNGDSSGENGDNGN